MHANAVLLNTLFTALHKHDHATMASCYRPDAHFRDIAFDRDGQDEIHDMWRMICNGDIEVTHFEIVAADDRAGLVRIVEDYTIGRQEDPPEDRRPVHNVIESRFVFKAGKILRQDDYCDAKEWARQAVGGGPLGFLAGRFRPVRSFIATLKLAAFRKSHPK